MRALWLEDRRLRLRDDVPIPAPPSGEALVRVIRAGICNTDIGSRCGPFAPALRLLEEQRVTVEPLIQARYALRDGLVAFERAQRPGVLKVLLEMDDGRSSRGSEVVRTA